MQKDNKEQTEYFLLLFKVEGHNKWRVNTFPSKDAFDTYLSKQEKHPKVIERKWFVVDRIVGDITQE